MAKWLPIVAISFLVAGVQGILTRSEKGEYGAYSKIFPLSINKSGGSSPLDAIRAQFGIDDKTDFDKIYNVKELVTSRTVSMNIARSKPNGSKYASMSAWLIDDYNNNVNNYYISAYSDSINNRNILARINISNGGNAKGLYQSTETDGFSSQINRSRNYFGPVNIEKLRITLYDDYGRIINLNNMDWSFVLELETLYK